MKKVNLGFWSFILSLLLVQGNLFAEMVRGQVTAINKENQSITILQQDSSGGTQGSKELSVREDAQFAGIQSLDDLEVGDEIIAEVDKKMFGKEEVRQLTSTTAQSDQSDSLQNTSAAGRATTAADVAQETSSSPSAPLAASDQSSTMGNDQMSGQGASGQTAGANASGDSQAGAGASY